MSAHLAGKKQAFRVIMAQLALTLAAASILLLFGRDIALSGLAGGSIAALGTGAFALWVFVSYQAQEPGRLLARFYGGEFLKLAVIVIGFAAAVLWLRPLSISALLGTYLLVAVVPMLIQHFFD